MEPVVGNAAMSKYGATVPFFIGSLGFRLTSCSRVFTSHPSGISPNSESTKRSGKRGQRSGGR